MPVLNPDHLLDQADRLMTPPGGGAPRQADLRRAISNAYYAVFHTIVTEAADNFVGRTQRQSAQYSLIYRSIEHRSLRRLCEEVIKPTLSAKYSRYQPRGGFGPDLIAVAIAVTDLHEKRQLADYDPMFRAVMSETVLAVATGRAALLRFRNANNARRRAFLTLLAFSPR